MTLGSELLITIAFGGCAACVAYVLLGMLRHVKLLKDLSEEEEILITETNSGIIRAFLPMARGLGEGVRMLLGGDGKTSAYARLHDSLGRNLSSAGNPEGLNADEFVGLGIIFSLFGSVLGGMMNLLLGADAFLSIYAYMALSAFVTAVWWKSWLTNKKIYRQTSIRNQLPFALDILTLAMEAGLDFTSALSRMARKIIDTPLGQEFSLMLREIQLGKTRSQALRDFSARVDVAEVGSVVASMVQAEELGSPLGPVLRILSSQQRERRSQRAEEMAMKAPVKMLFPLVVFIFPTTLIIIFAPLILSGLMSF